MQKNITMKKIPHFICTALSVLLFASCVNEEDFDFDRLAQTTLNPEFGLKLFETEASLSDFIDLDSLIAMNEGFELVTRNDQYGEYIELSFSSDARFDVEGFLTEIEGIEQTSFEWNNFFIPDIASLVGSGVDVSDMRLEYPAQEIEMGDMSIEIPFVQEGVSLDSVKFSSGMINFEFVTELPFDVYLEIGSSSLKDVATGEAYHQMLQICNTNGQSFVQSIDLSNQVIALKDSIGQGDKRFIDFRYRVVVQLGSNPSFSGGTYSVSSSIGSTPLVIETAFGRVGNVVVPIRDTIDLTYLENEEFFDYVDAGGIDFEKLRFELSAQTNVGIGALINLHAQGISSTGSVREFFPDRNQIYIRRAPSLNQIGETLCEVVETDADAAENFPKKVIYNLDAHFFDTLYTTDFPAFVKPHEAFLQLQTKTIIPIKARLTNLHYETNVGHFDFSEELEVLESAKLKLKVENTLPASTSFNFYLLDSTGVIFDSILADYITVNGAPVDANGNVLQPLEQTIEAELTKQKYEQLRQASDVRVKIRLNTTSDSEGYRPHVRFKKEAYIKLSATVEAVLNLTF